MGRRTTRPSEVVARFPMRILRWLSPPVSGVKGGTSTYWSSCRGRGRGEDYIDDRVKATEMTEGGIGKRGEVEGDCAGYMDAKSAEMTLVIKINHLEKDHHTCISPILTSMGKTSKPRSDTALCTSSTSLYRQMLVWPSTTSSKPERRNSVVWIETPPGLSNLAVLMKKSFDFRRFPTCSIEHADHTKSNWLNQ